MSEKILCMTMAEFIAEVRSAVAEGLEATVEDDCGRELTAEEFLRRWDLEQAKLGLN